MLIRLYVQVICVIW